MSNNVNTTFYQAEIPNNIKNRKVNVVDLTENFKVVPTKAELSNKIKELIAESKAIDTKTLGKMIDFKEDGNRDIVGHIVNSSRNQMNNIEIAQRKTISYSYISSLNVS